MANNFICYVNGRYAAAGEAHLSPYDLAVLRGFAVFDYLRVYGGVPFHLDRYLARFVRSVSGMKVPLVESAGEIEEIIRRLIVENGGGDFAVRLLATGGIANDGFSPPARGSLMVLFEPAPEPPLKAGDGITLIQSEHLREFPEFKTTGYLKAVSLHPRMIAAGASEMLYTWNGKVLECARSNFFIFKDQTLITPRELILHGVTRGVTLELAAGLFEVEVRPLAVSELAGATEAFITGTSPKITPVVKIEDYVIGNGRPGPNTLRLREKFLEYFAQQLARG